MTTQNEKLAALLKRKNGCTAFEAAMAIQSTCAHKRISELTDAGWTILKQKVSGKNYHRYFGRPPKAEPEHIPVKPPWPMYKF